MDRTSGWDWTYPEAAPWRTFEPELHGASWVVVLAGGEGLRIREFTTRSDGSSVPKQFCRFRDARSLFATTVDRAARLVPRERVITVVTEAHREWWEPEVQDLPPEQVLAQPLARGTALAILHALSYIRRFDSDPQVVFMPSDHEVESEDVLIGSVRAAMQASRLFPNDIVLLGVVPTEPETEYGMIVPRRSEMITGQRVRTFVEKPPAHRAESLMRRGAVWNSFILAATGHALVHLYERAVPGLLDAYRRGADLARGRRRGLRLMFERLPERDFSRDLLERNIPLLRLLTIPPCGWTDLGTPARLAAWLDHHRDAWFWREHEGSGLSDRLGLSAGT